MTSVRKTSGITVVLYIIIAVIVILTILSNNPDDVFVSRFHLMLESRSRIGIVHSFVLGLSFWALLISSVIDAVYREKKGLSILGSFGIPLGLTGYVAIWVLVSLTTYVDLRIFWLFYYFAIIICTKLSFNNMCKVEGSGPKKLKEFIKARPSGNDASINVVDRYVLYYAQASLLVLWFLQIVLAIVFCVQYSEMFPFL